MTPNNPRNAAARLSDLPIVLAIAAIMALLLSGCVANPSTQPTTGPSATVAAEVAFADFLRSQADVGNQVFQAAAKTDPSLATDAPIAQATDNELDVLDVQYDTDVETGVPATAVIEQIEIDAAEIAIMVAEHPSTATAYKAIKKG